MKGAADQAGPRPLWLTVPLYVVLVGVIGVDVWAAVFWAAVGGGLGLFLTVAAAVVVLLLGALLLTDVRRQWRSYRWAEERPTG